MEKRKKEGERQGWREGNIQREVMFTTVDQDIFAGKNSISLVNFRIHIV